MKIRLLSALVVLMLALTFFAACTDSENSGESPTAGIPGTVGDGEATATPVSLTPGPTQTMPPGKEVAFQVSPGYPSRFKHDLTITFSGGKGQSLLKENIEVRVTKSTGEAVTETLHPIVGDAVTISDAEGENRIEVTVSLVTGGTYKVMDRIEKVP